MPDDLSVHLQGLDENLANRIGAAVIDIVREVGRRIDVSSLDGVTVAVDYDSALSGLDTGGVKVASPGRTNDGDLTGVAKSIIVRRGDRVKTHLVLSAQAVACLGLDDSEEDLRLLSLAIVSHECAHVEDHGLRERQFPGSLLEILQDRLPAMVRSLSESIWGEYAACRASACFVPDQTQQFRGSLSLRLDPAAKNARQAISAFRTHGDIRKVLQEVVFALLEPLRMAAYLFGHLDGLAEDNYPPVDQVVPVQHGAFVAPLEKLVSQLRLLWETREHWTCAGDLDVLGQTSLTLLGDFGMHIYAQPDGGLYVSIPPT